LKKLLPYLFILLFFAEHQLFAQESGRLTGVIVDSQNGEPLIGANVYLEGTSSGAATDLDGNYVILNIPAGRYELVVMMIGYEEVHVRDTEVKAGTIMHLDLSLNPQILETEVVTVEARAIKNTEAALLKQRQKSIAVSDAIGSEAIARSGSGDAAEAIKQVTGASVVDGKYVYIRGLGDRYTSTQLNGAELPSTDPYKRSGTIDMISSDLVDNIVTIKSFTPDRPGNFSGGTVDINTKDFPDRFTFSFSTSATYNNQTTFKNSNLVYKGGNTDWLGFDDGGRAIPGLLNANDVFIPSISTKNKNEFDLLAKQTGSFNKQMTPSLGYAGINQGYSFSIGNSYNIFNKPFGFIASLTYKHKFVSYKDGIKREWNLAPDAGRPMQETYDYADSKTSEEALLGAMVKGSIKLSSNHNISINTLLNQNGESTARKLTGFWDDYGESELTTTLLSYTERSLKSLQLSGEHYFPGFLKSKINWKASLGSSSQNEPDRRVFAYGYNKNKNLYIVKPNTVPARYFRALKEDRNSLSFDWEVPFKQWFGQNSKLKFGGLISSKDRFYGERLFKVDGAPNISFNGNLDSLFSEENYKLRIDTTVTTIRGNDYVQYNTSGLFVRETKLPKNKYTANEKISASYAMLEMPLLDDLKFIGGIRLETTTMNVKTGTKNTGNANDYSEAKINEIDLLPSINFVFSITDKMNLRTAYSKTLARPTFREFAPYYSEDFIGGSVYIGNDQLKRTLIYNWDLRWEWYDRPGEIYAVSMFYKDFKNPIEPVLLGQNNERSWVNVDNALVYGVEFELRKKLDIIHKKLSNFSIGGNVSLINSEVDIDEKTLEQIRLKIPNASSKRPFQGQSPLLLNLTLNYDNLYNNISMTMYYNVFGRRLSEVARNGSPDIYEKPFHLLNFNANWQFTKIWNVKFAVSNILNSGLEKIQTYKNIDYIQSQYNRGVDFNFGIGYKL
jgi:outer membrane receptor protein involved in Fe transport